MHRRLRHRAAWLLLACLLFAQGAMAAKACLLPAWRTPAAGEAVPGSRCHEAPTLTNLCLFHCADQSDQGTGGPADALAADPAPRLVLARMPHPQALASIASASPPGGVDPPIPIRYSRLLN